MVTHVRLCRPTLEMVLEQLQSLRAGVRRTTDPLTPYDIESMIVRKASINTANKAHLRSPGGPQHPAARSPVAQQGAAPFTSLSTHAGRLQQQQRQHRAARRAVSTPQLKPGSPASPQPLRSVASATPQQLTHRQSSGAAAAAAAMAAAGASSASQAAAGMDQVGGGPQMASSYPGVGVGGLASTLHQIWDDGDEGEGETAEGAGNAEASGSDRSVYLEHSASTADDHYEDWEASGGVSSRDEVSFRQQGLQLSSGTIAPALQQHSRQSLDHPSCGFGSFASQPSTGVSLAGSKPVGGGCPFAAAAGAAAAPAGPAAEAGTQQVAGQQGGQRL